MRYVLVAGLVSLAACAHLSQQDKTELATYEGEQSACIAAFHDNKAALDDCRSKVQAKWCAIWKQRFGQDVCYPDGGT